jgi:cell division protein FtsW
MARNQNPTADGLHQTTFFELSKLRVLSAAEAPNPVMPAAKLFGVVLALMGIGMVIQASHAASTTSSLAEWFDLIKEHLIFRLAGIVALIGAYRFGPRGARRFLPFLMVFVALSLILVYTDSFGVRLNGARRWVRMLPGLTFQPSELARIVLVIWIADRCVRLGDKLLDFRTGLLPMLLVVGIFFGLVAAETDLGGSLLLFVCALATMWVGGGKVAHLALSVISVGGGAIVLGATMIPYIRGRVDMFRGGVINEQVMSSMHAIQYGGLEGVGIGQGQVRTSGIPYLNSDYVFSQIGEELGLFGTSLVILLLLSFLWFSLRLVLSIRGRFEALVAFGLLMSVSVQAMIHVQVNAGLAPPKGMTLPFISDGGTSLIVSSIAVGLALGASRQSSSSTTTPQPEA